MISVSKMDTMRNFGLLFLCLITGCQAYSEVKACTEGWVEFTCKHPETYKNIYVSHPRRRVLSTKKDVWDNDGRFSLYRDTRNNKLNVTITQLQHFDSGEYRCIPEGSRSSFATVKLEVEDDKNVCQEAFFQTAYRTAKTTISCGYKGNPKESKFFCKDNGSVCEDILTTPSSLRSKGTFTLTESSSSFNMSISNVSSQHAGVYWCGVEANGGRYRAARRQIRLEVKATITNFTRFPTVGQRLSYWCQYPETQLDHKFICKGEDPSICEPVVTTEQLNHNTGRFSMKDDTEKRNITITVRDVTSEDTGTYWCGARTTDQTHSNPFFHRFTMTVAPAAAGGRLLVITVIVCVAALLLLLFLLILILIYKRHSTNKRKAAAAAQLFTEEYVYEEIQAGHQKPDSEHAMNSIYVTANFPTNPSASLHYSTISFHLSSGEAGGEALTTKPNSSVCEYSTVKYCHRPTDSNVHHPSSEDPLYSTVNKQP